MAAPSTLNLTTRRQFEHALVEEKVWAIVTSTCLFLAHAPVEKTQPRFPVNQGASDNLTQVLASGNGPYNGTSAVTVYINEARSSTSV
jgi:hypothetical protein